MSEISYKEDISKLKEELENRFEKRTIQNTNQFQGAIVEKSNLMNWEKRRNLKSRLFSTFIELAIEMALSL